MALTKFEIASSALVLIGANPVAAFNSAGTTEEIACYHLWQNNVDHWLSLYPWRFATRQTQLPRDHQPPNNIVVPIKWTAVYFLPPDIKALQAIHLNRDGRDIPFDRFENQLFCNATVSDAVYAVHTYEPPIAWWPGYFVALIEISMAAKLAFALSAKLDLRMDMEKQVDPYFRLAKNADSRQQTTRRFRVDGRRSIMEARRA